MLCFSIGLVGVVQKSNFRLRLLVLLSLLLLLFDLVQAYTEAMPIHPLFMDEEDFKNPEMVDNNPALEAINQLIESATPRERAVQSKEDGNQYFKIGQKELQNISRPYDLSIRQLILRHKMNGFSVGCG